MKEGMEWKGRKEEENWSGREGGERNKESKGWELVKERERKEKSRSGRGRGAWGWEDRGRYGERRETGLNEQG